MSAKWQQLGFLGTLMIALASLYWPSMADAATTTQDGACAVYLARPDPRDCYGLPYCGGYFIYLYDRPVEDLCTADLPFAGYVTRLVYIDDDGSIVPFDAPCDQPLTGSFQPDPSYPEFNMFVALACVQ